MSGGGSISQMGFMDDPGLSADIRDELGAAFAVDKNATLSDRFGVPPFTVLDSRQGYWQDRKRAWIGLGIDSELGRGDELLGFKSLTNSDVPCPGCEGAGRVDGLVCQQCGGTKTVEKYEGLGTLRNTSIFDPVLCELMFRWYTPQDGRILDPFAGGSVRGIVASKLGRHYTGVDLRPEQCEANRAQAADIAPDIYRPEWIAGDSLEEVPKLVCASCRGMNRVRQPDGKTLGVCGACRGQMRRPYDFVFSCPPYFDLEQYSDDPRDLSNAGSYEKFCDEYWGIVAASVAALRDNAFACFVVGDIRDKKGMYRGFVSDTIIAFKRAGAPLYNEAVLINPVGTLAVRASRQFGPTRKLGKGHQNVLIFCKGDPKAAVVNAGEITVDAREIWT